MNTFLIITAIAISATFIVMAIKKAVSSIYTLLYLKDNINPLDYLVGSAKKQYLEKRKRVVITPKMWKKVKKAHNLPERLS